MKKEFLMSIHPVYKNIYFSASSLRICLHLQHLQCTSGAASDCATGFVHQVLLLTVYMTLYIAVRRATISKKRAFCISSCVFESFYVENFGAQREVRHFQSYSYCTLFLAIWTLVNNKHAYKYSYISLPKKTLTARETLNCYFVW